MGKKISLQLGRAPARADTFYKLLDSPAFRAISHAARQAFWRLVVREHGRHGGKENGRLVCTRRDLEAWGVPKNLAARAIRELVAVKLVEITRAGAAGNADQRRAATYRLTCFAAVDREGNDGSHDYERIETDEEAIALVETACNLVSKRDAANGRKGAAAAKIQNSGRKSEAGTGRKSEATSPAANLRPQGPAGPNLRPLSTSRPQGGFSIRTGPGDRKH